MAVTIKSVTNGNYTHTISCELQSQNVSANTSTFTYEYTVRRNVAASSGAFGSGIRFKATVAGTSDTETHSFDFTSQQTYTVTSGTRTLTHDADGTRATNVSFDGPLDFVSSGMPETTGSGVYTLPTIPRASTPTFDQGGPDVTAVDAGTAVTISTNRASSSFTHDITYTFGTLSGTIATGVTSSTSWTPPTSLLNEIPNTNSGVASIKTVTRDGGGSSIGTKTVNLTINVPATAIPTIAGTTVSEATSSPAVATIVGSFVQSISKLNLAMTGVAGIYGSTIVTRTLQIDGQTIIGAAGTTALISSSGTLVLTATVTDSRGKIGVRTANVTVLPYVAPSIGTFTVKRATAGGTIDPNGTYFSINLIAAVQSLVVGSQKNTLTYKFKKQARGGTALWSSVTPDVTTTPGGVSVSTTFLPGVYPITNSYDVRIEVTDALGTMSAVQGTISTGGVLMNLSTTYDGIGVGKYWNQGSVDALGQMYQNNGQAVVDSAILAAALSSLVPTATVVNTAARVAPTGWLMCDGSAVSRTTYAALFAALVTNIGVTTITIAAPAVFSRATHGLSIGDQVYFTTTGALPTGLTASTNYFVVSVPTTGTFTLSTTLGGTPITTTGTQSGVHTMFLCPYGVGNGSTTFNVPNLKGSTVMGRDTSQVEFSGQGQVGGAKVHSFTLSDNGQAQFTLTATGNFLTRQINVLANWTPNVRAGTSTPNTTYTVQTVGAGLQGSTDSGSTLDPYVVMAYIIKT